ncbi:MAG TPA: hypothetical protein VK826_18665 [Bacteroidia bacterium]|nr:hypothetical protein [Bacteroidia bacterium]
MTRNSGTETYFDSTSLIEFFWRWRKPLVLIGLGAVLISSIVSLLIPEKFKSTVIMFPVQSNAISKALLTEDFSGKQDVLQFGEEEQAEQMLQILNSDEIRSVICKKYDLLKAYRIDPNDRFKNTKLFMMYSENITFKRTEFMSVRVDVMDEDSKRAADIANDIAALLDSTKRRMQRDRALQAFGIVESEYLKKKAEVELMQDSMFKINQKGMYDYESQSEVTSQQYAIALAKGDQRAIQSLQEQLKIIADYGSAYMAVRENLYIQREQLNLLKKKYEEAKVDANAILSYKFIVNPAYAAERKSYPIRWLIVMVSTAASLVFGILFLILFDNIRQLRKREKFSEKQNA